MQAQGDKVIEGSPGIDIESGSVAGCYFKFSQDAEGDFHVDPSIDGLHISGPTPPKGVTSYTITVTDDKKK